MALQSRKLVGQRFGKLTVISQRNNSRNSYCKCICDCRTEKMVLGDMLQRNITVTCGCLYIDNPPLQLVGQRFGRVVVLSQAANNGGYTYWNCICDCGKKTKERGINLKIGYGTNCGCHKRGDIERTQEKSAIHSLYTAYKSGAEKRKYDFDLTIVKFEELIRQPCYYCGLEKSNMHKKEYTKEKTYFFYYNGIDRLVNNLGYKIDNSVPCCWPCNQWKGKLSLTEFKARIFQLAKNLPSNNEKVVKQKKLSTFFRN